MNPNTDDLESQLMQIPLKRFSRRLKRRIAKTLADTTPNIQGGRNRRRALSGIFAVAASVLITLALWNKVHQEASPRSSAEKEVAKISKLPPTIKGYQTAMTMGLEALDSLLDRHARVLLPPQRGPSRVRDYETLLIHQTQDKETWQ